jgi:hypothetical protein
MQMYVRTKLNQNIVHRLRSALLEQCSVTKQDTEHGMNRRLAGRYLALLVAVSKYLKNWYGVWHVGSGGVKGKGAAEIFPHAPGVAGSI